MDLPKLPYRAEYAKSGRSGCRICKEPIDKDSLRLAHMVQSPVFDGMQPNWHHYSCFFMKFRPKDVTDIAHFESLRWNDQETIRNKISELINGPTGAIKSGKGSKSRKRNNAEVDGVPDLADYTVEYAKSKRSKCKVCEEFIDKNEVRISKKDFENEIARQYGPTERWHHVDCFIKAREELSFFACASVLPGFKALSPDDQNMLKTKVPAIQRTDITDGPSPTKKPKEDKNLKKKLKDQNDAMFKYKDALEALKKSELTSLLRYNNQDIPEGTERILERLSEAMAFGALKRCEKCNGQLVFRSGVGYQCLGDISEWSKCQSIYTKPGRVPFKIPDELKENYKFLKDYKGKVKERLFNQISPDKASTSSKPEKSKPVLDSLKVFIHKTDSKSSKDLMKQVENLGGSVVSKWEEGIFAVVSTNAELEKAKLPKALKSAKDLEIVVVADTFFDDITATTAREDFINKIQKNKISPWDCDASKKLQTAESSKSVYRSQSKSIFKSKETTKKVTVKDGLAVDPDSLLDKIAHVYRKGDDVYSVVLGLTDIQTGKNSFYKLQVLESDKKNNYWLFRSWGRIGTAIGGNKVEEYDSLDSCIEVFKDLFEEKSGNQWRDRKNFKKVPGKMMMLDIQDKDEKVGEVAKPKLKSEFLPQPVQDLITLIFDIEAMKKTMLEFELDLHKMPLGKLSQRQIQNAFGILSELQNLLTSAAEKHLIIEKTNMFYTLIPHDCGINVPPVLDNEDIIKEKIDMLNSLMDIEIAYKLLEECKDSDNSIDDHYKKLNADISVLSKDTEEYKIIELYVKNTHAKTHMNYTLDIEHIFKIERKGEAKKFKKFSKLPNRRLLWHGSRVTNFAGILSQGLRIAPPEAPVTGYMFGKGIYFADMVSKSANYCNTTKKNPTGLILLCEVALGNMHELKSAENIVKLPPGKNSVKGVGKTEPDPKEKVITPTGAEVIIGKGIDSKVDNSALLYNEYIVYNVAQVKIQYLLRLKFNHKI